MLGSGRGGFNTKSAKKIEGREENSVEASGAKAPFYLE
jgi:hypothetical protein